MEMVTEQSDKCSGTRRNCDTGVTLEDEMGKAKYLACIMGFVILVEK